MQMATRAAVAERRKKKPLAKQIEEDLEHLDSELSLPEVNGLLTCLWHKKEAMEKQESQVKMQLLLQFLHHARRDLLPFTVALLPGANACQLHVPAGPYSTPHTLPLVTAPLCDVHKRQAAIALLLHCSLALPCLWVHACAL